MKVYYYLTVSYLNTTNYSPQSIKHISNLLYSILSKILTWHLAFLLGTYQGLVIFRRNVASSDLYFKTLYLNM
jgi:hypothetical protein